MATLCAVTIKTPRVILEPGIGVAEVLFVETTEGVGVNADMMEVASLVAGGKGEVAVTHAKSKPSVNTMIVNRICTFKRCSFHTCRMFILDYIDFSRLISR